MTTLADIHVNLDGTGTVELDGRTYPLAAPDIQTARHAGVGLILDHAAHTGQPVHVTARDPHTEHHLLVTAHGEVLPASAATRACIATAPPDPRHPTRRPQLLGAGLLLIAGAAALAIPLLGRQDHNQPPPAAQPAPAAPAQQPVEPLTVAGTASVTAPSTPTKPVELPGLKTSARWAPAATWQAAADAKAAAKRRAARQRQAAAAQPQYQAPVVPPATTTPQYQPPAVTAPQNPAAPPNPTQPDVRIYPDPDINPN